MTSSVDTRPMSPEEYRAACEELDIPFTYGVESHLPISRSTADRAARKGAPPLLSALLRALMRIKGLEAEVARLKGRRVA